MLHSVILRIGIIFTVILVGALARWRRIINQETTDGLCRIAIEVTLPFLYFYTLATNLNSRLLASLWSLPFLAVLLTALSYLVGWLVSLPLKLDAEQKRSFMFLVSFANYGFLAIPLVFALYGQDGLVHIFIFNLGVAFLYWTFGVAILSGRQKKAVFKNLLNNSMLGLAVGLLAGASSLRLPQFILEVARMIGNISIPLALIVVGSLLVQRNAQPIAPKILFSLIFARLILIPAIALALVNIFDGLPKIISVLIVLQAAMPSASTAPILTRRFGGDSELAASGVFYTTLCSLVTVPLFISLALR